MHSSRRVVRRVLEMKGLSLEPIGGSLVDLSPTSTPEVGREVPGSTAHPLKIDTLPRATAKDMEQRRSRWSILFGLAYRVGSRSIPLDPTCEVRVRIRGETVELDWHNLPSRDRLPPESELRPNVTPEKAIHEARADFLERIGGNTLKDDDLDSDRPREELWFGTDGPGRLAWALTVTVKPGMIKPSLRVHGAQYELEARTPAEGRVPSILRSSSPTLHSLTGTTSPDRRALAAN